MRFGGINEHFVVVAPGGEVGSVLVPFQPTDLLLVGVVGLHLVPHSEVIEVYFGVPGPGQQQILKNGEGSYPLFVVRQSVQDFFFLHVPILDHSSQRSDEGLLAIAVPRNGADYVEIIEVRQFFHHGGREIPHVRSAAEAHEQVVVHPPVQHVEIVVILQKGSVEDFEGIFLYLSAPFGVLLVRHLDERCIQQELLLQLRSAVGIQIGV